MARQPVGRRTRSDYAPNVRPRETAPVGAHERAFAAPRAPAGSGARHQGIITVYGTIAAANTTVQTLANKATGYQTRLVHFTIWIDAADVDIVEIYWGTAANLAAAAESETLYEEPMNAIYQKFTRTWGVGLGPIGARSADLRFRRVNATAGTLHAMSWYTRER